MAQSLTIRTRQILDSKVIRPNLVLEIDGISTVFGSLVIEEVIKIGDTGLKIGEPLPGESLVWVIGGLKTLADQSDVISPTSGTSSQIKTSLNTDRGFGEAITSIQISALDTNEALTDIISPGVVVADILGRKCRVWYGFQGTSFKEDYLIIFRGIIDSVESQPGLISFSISHPDTKKKSSIWAKAETLLNGAITNLDTTITVDDTTKFFTRVLGPDGAYDTMVKYYMQIDDEIILYTDKTPTQFTGCIRGQLETVAAAHDDNSNVQSIVRLDGDAITLALKTMFSGRKGSYRENLDVTNFVRTSSTSLVTNAIYFQDFDIELETGVVVGDYVSTSGATDGASNDVTLKEISSIIKTDTGSYVTITGASLAEEISSPAVMSIRSQYDVWDDGLRMLGEDVDIDSHLKVFNRFLSAFEYDFVLTDTIENAKEWLSKQIYNPSASFSIPRSTRSGCGYHLGPIPGDEIKTIDNTNCLNPGSLKITRSTFKNFANTVIYKFQKEVLDDKFLRGTVGFSQTSRDRIPVGNKSFVVESDGLRSWSVDNSSVAEPGEAQATAAINRKLKKFKFGAEYINGIKLPLSVGMSLEVDDVILLDLPSLQITDIQTGSRSGKARLFQIVNWALDLLKGVVTIDCLDPNFDKDNKYALIGPSSLIKAGISTTQFIIEDGFYSGIYGIAEFKKWERLIGTGVRIHNLGDTVTDTSVITVVSGNTISVSPALAFTPAAGYRLSLDKYNNSIAAVTAKYGFMSTGIFDDGSAEYKMI